MSADPVKEAVERVVWRWQDEAVLSRSNIWYVKAPVFGERGPFATREEAEADLRSLAPKKALLEKFARVVAPRVWEEFDRLGDRDGFLFDTLYASMADAQRILSTWRSETATALQAAEAENERLRLAHLRPGVMRCAKCEFRLIRNVLFAQSGNIGAGTSETEPCPNGCGPLWPVTWKDECQAADKLWDQQVERAVAAEAERDAAQERATILQQAVLDRVAERDAAREALKPFAAVSAKAKGADDACWCGQDGAVIRYRDLRTAARALTPENSHEA